MPAQTQQVNHGKSPPPRKHEEEEGGGLERSAGEQQR